MQVVIEKIEQPSKKRPITEIAILGDSLSDSGTTNASYLLGIIPMSFLSGLMGKSPLGSFTNGYVWSGDFVADLANQFTIKHREHGTKAPQYDYDAADKADDILNHSGTRLDKPKRNFNAENADDIGDDIVDCALNNGVNFNLDSHSNFNYKGIDFVKNYAEGGLTAGDYWGLPSKSISRFFARLILKTLADKRAKLLKDDQERKLSQSHKAKKLIIEWSGANDLITVNEKPSKEEVDKAIAARIENIKELIRNDYQNFALYNLPNLSLTPRYQAKSLAEQQNAEHWSNYFNIQLAQACKELQTKYPYFIIEVIDVNKKFEEIYANPAVYGLNPALKHEPFQKSPDFNNKDRISDDPDGHIFWDSVHPTARVQKLLEVEVLRQLSAKFDFKQPHEVTESSEVIELDPTELYNQFRTAYKMKLEQEKGVCFFGLFRRSNLKIDFNDSNINPEFALKEILNHGLYQKGGRTKEIMQELKWIDNNGNLLLNITELKRAKQHLDRERKPNESSPLLSS